MRFLFGVVVMMFGSVVALAESPKVVKASPDDGASDVDPATNELRVEFDQPMDRGGMSIVGGGDNFPKILGRPHWVDDKTISVAIKLEPDHEYALSINNATFANFKNKNGESAEPYPISFKTAGAAGAASQPAALDNKTAVEVLKAAIDRDYSYRDRLKIDWAKRFVEADPNLLAAKTPKEFAKVAAKVLEPAQDIHLYFKVGDQFIGTSRMTGAANWNEELLPKLVPAWLLTPPVARGIFKDGIGYILIASWSTDAAAKIEKFLPTLKDTRALVVDVRPNAGGDEPTAIQFAGIFVDKPTVYSKNTNRRDGVDHGPYDRVLEPNTKWSAYRNKVVVLMGARNVSTCESFLLMMKQAGATLVGEKSHGSSGNPKPHDLGNGVTLLLPSWFDMLPDGTPLEGVGVKPDVEVKTKLSELQERDPVLEAALKILRGE